MTTEELNTKLYKKMFAEQEQYRDWLLSQPSEEILNHCYEYTVREDILMSLEYHDLPSVQARALLKSPSPLADVFTDWEHKESGYMDDTRKTLLMDIFWQMHEISYETETSDETVIEETDDGHGNIVETATTVTQTTLYITVDHKTAEEMADHFGFNADQREQLAELLDKENNALWAAVLYGIGTSDDAIVAVALSQVGNIGGQPYWSWYGFDCQVAWCACFVSWCANECSYIETGVIPKFAGCSNGVQWFRERGQWADNSIEPAPGMIIFFDWEGDGEPDHVGIVEKNENGIVYTIEGNSGDTCRQRQYFVGSSLIYGYGIPAY